MKVGGGLVPVEPTVGEGALANEGWGGTMRRGPEQPAVQGRLRAQRRTR